MYSFNNGKMDLMQNKMAVLVSVILIAACNFHILVTFLRSAKITRESTFPLGKKIPFFCSYFYSQYTSAFKNEEGSFLNGMFDAINRATLGHLVFKPIERY